MMNKTDKDIAKQVRMLHLRLKDLAKSTDLTNHEVLTIILDNLASDTNVIMCQLTRNDESTKEALWDITDSGLDHYASTCVSAAKEG